jgi:flagellar biosynthetic protein FlhB
LIHKSHYLLSYHLQFFAEGAEKTEQPTAKKLADARREGQVARSKELTTSTELVALFLTLKIFIGYIVSRFLETFIGNYQNIGKMLDGDFTIVKGFHYKDYGHMPSHIYDSSSYILCCGSLSGKMEAVHKTIKAKIQQAKPSQWL